VLLLCYCFFLWCDVVVVVHVCECVFLSVCVVKNILSVFVCRCVCGLCVSVRVCVSVCVR
jgi:hypothetical protein